MTKEYLGDSVYVEPWSDAGIVLTTENGYKPSNVIYLEAEIIDFLLLYIARMRESLKKEDGDDSTVEDFRQPSGGGD